MKPMHPSTFAVFPWSSVLQNSQSEQIAKNIMVILGRTRDIFRPLSWEEYKEERLKDGQFTEGERYYFDKVIKYCQSAETAVLFSRSWAELV
jgi:hypothetical protein